MHFYNFLILLVVSLVLYITYLRVKKTYSFFQRHGIPYVKPTYLFGNLKDVILLRKSMAEAFAQLYEALEPHRFGGFFAATKPILLIRDPDLLKDILVKDFAYFSDRGWKVNKKLEPLSDHLFTMHVDDWKQTRMKLNPIFTTGKMKMMFPLVKKCGENLSEVVGLRQFDNLFDVKDLTARYTTDVIASCVFGLEVHSLNDPNVEFRTMGKNLTKLRLRSLLRILEFDIPQFLNKLFKVTFFDLKSQQFFGDTVLKTIAHREKHNVRRNDLISLLIELKTDEKFIKNEEATDENDSSNIVDQAGCRNESKNDLKITNQLLASQGFIFFFAGFETSSTSLSYTLMELSQNTQIQDKVRQEIVDVISSNDGQLTYDLLKQMTYTDMVIQESLRKYPPNSILQRRAIKNYKIRDSNVVIPAGTWILVTNYGIHRDHRYYPNPDEFRPERFSEEEKSKRPDYTYLPFGEGPHSCIAARFARMMIKVGLIHALSRYSYRLSPQMKFPIEFDKNLGLLSPSNSILMERERIA